MKRSVLFAPALGAAFLLTAAGAAFASDPGTGTDDDVTTGVSVETGDGVGGDQHGNDTDGGTEHGTDTDNGTENGTGGDAGTENGTGGENGDDGATLPPVNEHPGNNVKVYVCKYVGTPGLDERLQTGDNPIEVSVNATGGAAVGSYFEDQHGRSYVLGVVGEIPEPSVDDCPAGDTPETTTPETTVPETTVPETTVPETTTPETTTPETTHPGATTPQSTRPQSSPVKPPAASLPPRGDGGGLATTGADVAPFAGAGALLLLGGALVLALRRRSASN